jgi:hypothetical protein
MRIVAGKPTAAAASATACAWFPDEYAATPRHDSARREILL